MEHVDGRLDDRLYRWFLGWSLLDYVYRFILFIFFFLNLCDSCYIILFYVLKFIFGLKGSGDKI